MQSSLLLSSTDLADILRMRYPFAQVWVLDKDYNVPTQAAVNVYFKELASVLFETYGDKWREFFDCDNFTMEAITLAYRKHFLARFAGKGNAQGVAIGLLVFRTVPTDLLTGHCIAFWVDGDKQVHEFEPQNRLANPLTPAQCLSASLCLVC